MAAIAQRAENGYVGVNCGIMDQFASAAGRAGHALLIDCRTNTATASPLPAGLSIVVCDTGSPRRLDSSAYNTRRSECELGVRLIAEREPGVKSLRDVDAAMLARNRGRLPEVVGRRCEHVVRENERVIATVDALREGDLEALGRLFAASHESLRDLFEVSSAELDAMVEIARGGARRGREPDDRRRVRRLYRQPGRARRRGGAAGRASGPSTEAGPG